MLDITEIMDSWPHFAFIRTNLIPVELICFDDLASPVILAFDYRLPRWCYWHCFGPPAFIIILLFHQLLLMPVASPADHPADQLPKYCLRLPYW